MNAADITAAARSVRDIDAHFVELKQGVNDLAQRVDAENRGLFTPAEEEESLGLLVSYWQARAALLELVTDFQSDDELSDEQRPAAFLAAFAAALTLVDAARFLREKVHEKHVVREKLNQASPEFGIPKNVYDTVQASLLRTRHAWHLYHAVHYFQENEPQLRELAGANEIGDVFGIVDRHRHRLNVSVGQLARTKLRARVSRTVRHVFKGSLKKAFYGLAKLAGSMAADKYIRVKHKPQLPARVVQQLHQILAPGDVLVVRKEFALTNYFLPGHWPHAVLYLGQPQELAQLGLLNFAQVKPRWAMLLDASSAGAAEPRRVLESKKDGVRIRSLASPLASDSLVVLRPQLDEQDRTAALARAISHEGKRYDFTFDFRRSDRLVCTEVVYRGYDGIGGIQFPLVRRAGRPTLAGRDLLRMAVTGQHFEPVAVFEPNSNNQLITGPAAMDVLKRRDRPD